MSNIELTGTRYKFDRAPDHCPICHAGIEPVQIGGNVIKHRSYNVGTTIQIIYRCPREQCQRAFIGTFWQRRSQTTQVPDGDFLLRNTSPFHHEETETPEEIKAISPNYHKIYSQSEAAEHSELTEIAGCGYRKALEFLIKDYAIHKIPDNADTITRKFLGPCINDCVSDANVKACAARAAWLGNDETHFERRWKEKDINDLKVLLRLTEAWILNELLTERYLQEM